MGFKKWVVFIEIYNNVLYVLWLKKINFKSCKIFKYDKIVGFINLVIVNE